MSLPQMTLHIPPRMLSLSHQQQHLQHQQHLQQQHQRRYRPRPELDADLYSSEHRATGGLDADGRLPDNTETDLTGGYSINRTTRLDEEDDEGRPSKEHRVRPRFSSSFLRRTAATERQKQGHGQRQRQRQASDEVDEDVLRPSGSSSTSPSLHSRSQHSSASRLYHASGTSSGDLVLRDYVYRTSSSQSTTDLSPSTDFDVGLTARKAKKQKRRPPMIDLSKLFPRPRRTAIPLSPNQIAVASPSSPPSELSHGSDGPVHRTAYKLSRLARSPDTKRPARMHLYHQQELHQNRQQQQYQDNELMAVKKPTDQYSQVVDGFVAHKDHQQQQSGLSPDGRRMYENGWRSPDIERQKVSSAWFDSQPSATENVEEACPGDQIEIMYGQLISRDQHQHTPPPLTRDRRSLSLPSHQASVKSGKTGQANLVSPNDIISHNKTSPKPATSAGHPVKLNCTMPYSASCNSQSLTNGARPVSSSAKEIPRIRKKSSRAILNASNLNESSVLCLSSSEEEEDYDHEDKSDDESSYTTRLRDSITTIDEGFQICTAQTVTAARRPSIKRVRSSSKKRLAKNSSTPRLPNGDRSRPSTALGGSSTASVAESSYSNVPTLPERASTSPLTLPRIHTQFSQAESAVSSSQAGSRRSRVIAVTRQEEYLLEMIRRNKGTLPHTLSPDGSTTTTSKEWAKALAVQINRQSVSSYGSDTSFLRLSPALPPTPHQKRAPRAVPNLATPSIPSDAASPPSVPLSAASDASYHSPRTLPRISLVNSGICFPSPPSGGQSSSSPFTPTRQFRHRRHSSRQSTTPSMPSVKEGLRNRAETTTTYDEKDDTEKDIETNPDIPIWALGWNSEATGIAVAH